MDIGGILKIKTIIKKEEEQLITSDFALVSEGHCMKRYDDIISHDSYWVIQDTDEVIKQRIIHEAGESIYMFDCTKLGASEGCLRIDIYDTDTKNPNAIVNIFSLIETGRWLDNSVIDFNNKEDMGLILSFVKHDDLRDVLMKKTEDYIEPPELLNKSIHSDFHLTDSDTLMTSSFSSVSDNIQHRPLTRQAQHIDFYFGGDFREGRTSTYVLPSNVLSGKPIRKKNQTGCVCVTQ